MGFWSLESSKGCWRKFLLSLKPAVMCKPPSTSGSVDISGDGFMMQESAPVLSVLAQIQVQTDRVGPKGGLLAGTQSFLSGAPDIS